MNNPVKVVVDADAIIAQVNPNDQHHQRATEISKFLAKMNAQVVYPATAIAESNAYMQRVLNSTASAYSTALVFTDSNVQVADINQNYLIKFHELTKMNQNTVK